ncbi:hypothetical protein B0H14DRAFT_3875690 [Mycena olivaceomarginata]|nr:hypothetical protein B0H14DRAFT_3875690 [Mycena olivaceomarginata]
MWRKKLAASAVFLLARRVAADNLQCTGTGMNWYINLVGETPCQTYQNLRQICNSNYNVGVLTINTPPDYCTDQLSTCCCNSISFALSMLCLNCQQNIGDGIGVDAGAGAYTDYLKGCSNPQLHTIPTNIQTAICNKNIKIEDGLYTNGFADGGWRYILSRDTILADNATANGKSFTHCPDTSASSSSSTSPSSSSSSPSPSSPPSQSIPATTKKALSSGVIGGIAVGGLIIGVAAAAAIWGCYYRRRRTTAKGLQNPFDGGMREVSEQDFLADNVVAHAYTYNNEPPVSTAPSSFAAPHSVGDTGSVTGYTSASSSRGLSIRNGDSSFSKPYIGGAGPLPRKRDLNSSPGGQRAGSEEPFLEEDPAAERHHDAGPVLGEGLQRSASGRLPPAYGEQV